MKYLYRIFVLVLLAALRLSLVTAQEDELQPGLAMYMNSLPATLYAKPESGAERLGAIEPGDVVTIIEMGEGSWAYVAHGDIEGWMRNIALVNIAEEDLLDPDDPLPPPTGPYQVGQTYRYWEDTSREETLTDEAGDYRELVVTIWYPADVADGAERTLYWEAFSWASEDEVLALFDTPLAEKHLELKSHAYRDAPLADSGSRYPVVIVSHGYTSFPEELTLQALELGSHGYIVVAINHTYYSGITVFPDGRVVSNPELLTADRQWEQAEATVAQDVTFVIDQLEILDAGDPGATLTRGLDLDRIGLMGFSLGGESAVLAGSRDDRIDAIVNEDGVIVPASIPRVEQPLMFLSGQLLFPESGGPDYSVLIRGFDHPSFSDVVVLFPGIGRVVPSRSVKIVRAYVLAFFDEYLKGIDQPLLDGPSGEFPEADLTVNISE